MKRAIELLKTTQSAYVVCHILPDGDAVGSLLGLGLALQSLGKTCTMACADPIPEKYAFLVGADRVVSSPPAGEQVIVSVDASDVERLGSLYDAVVYGSRPVLNIDHHVTNTRYGNLNLIRQLPSTAEIVYALLGSMQVPLDQDIANALLAGLLADTRCFRTSNVTARQLRTAIALIQAGASLARITDLLFNREPISTICLWGQALGHANTGGRIVWTEIDRDMLLRCGATPMEADGLSSFLASAESAEVSAVFREKEDGRIEVSMRAKPAWDISGVALKLGGGGHPRAAGCILPGPMQSARERVLAEIQAALQQQALSRPAEGQ